MTMIDYEEMLSECPDTEVTFGRSCFIAYGNLLTVNGARSVLVFTGKNSGAHGGLWERFLSLVSNYPVSFQRCPEVVPEPDAACVARLVEALDEVKPDAVAALGGGSVMDAAKAAWLVHQAGGRVGNYFGVDAYSSSHPADALKRVACFPTTSGTGSEVTPYSNVVENESGVKRLIAEKAIIPDYAFIYPEFTLTCPRDLTLAVAFDAMSHAIEGLLNVNEDDHNARANDWALACVGLIVKHLPSVLADEENLEAREKLAMAACLGGMVIRYKSTGLPHLCSFSWARMIPHGVACALTLPYAWRYYLGERAVRDRTLKLKGFFGVAGDDAEAVIEGYRDFTRRCGSPLALKDVPGLDETAVTAAAEAAAANEMKLRRAPRPVPLNSAAKVLSGILQNAWQGDLSDVKD